MIKQVRLTDEQAKALVHIENFSVYVRDLIRKDLGAELFPPDRGEGGNTYERLKVGDCVRLKSEVWRGYENGHELKELLRVERVDSAGVWVIDYEDPIAMRDLEKVDRQTLT